MQKLRQGKSYVVTFKDGSVSVLHAKSAEEAAVRARVALMDAPVPDGETHHGDPGIGCVGTHS